MIKARTVKNTTQADKLTFASAFDDCLVAPTIYHDDEPFTLFESIEIFGKDDETNITGFEVLITNDPQAIAYMQSDLDTVAANNDLNRVLSYFVNGHEQRGTLAHLIARNPAQSLNEYLPELLDNGLNFSVKDGNGKTALEYGNQNSTIIWKNGK